MYVYKHIYVSKGLRYKYKSLLKRISKKQNEALLYLIIINTYGQIEIVHNVFFTMHYNMDTKILGMADGRKTAIYIVKDIVSDIYIHKKDIYAEELYIRRF